MGGPLGDSDLDSKGYANLCPGEPNGLQAQTAYARAKPFARGHQILVPVTLLPALSLSVFNFSGPEFGGQSGHVLDIPGLSAERTADGHGHTPLGCPVSGLAVREAGGSKGDFRPQAAACQFSPSRAN